MLARTLWFFVLAFLHCSMSGKNPISIYELISEENIKSLAGQHQSLSKDKTQQHSSAEKQYHELLLEELADQLNPAQDSKRHFIFDLLIAHDQHKIIQDDLILDRKSWQDLELLSGPKSNISHYLAQRLDRTKTEFGRISFFKSIVCPQSTIESLNHQQQFTQLLVSNEKIYNHLSIQLSQLPIAENAILSFWHDELFREMMHQECNLIPFSSKINAAVTSNEYALEIYEKLSYLEDIFNTCMMGVGSVALIGCAALCLFDNSYGKQKLDDLTASSRIFGRPMTKYEMVCWLLRQASESRATKVTVGLLSGYEAFSWSSWYAQHAWKNRRIFGNCIQTKLIHVATYLSAVRSIIDYAHNNPELKQFNPIKQIIETFTSFEKSSSQLQKLISLLTTSTFKGNASFFSFKGRVYAAYLLMQRFKCDFINLMIAVGNLDAQLSIATLYKEFEHNNVRFCFPTFLENCAQPSFELKQFWNPMLDHTTAVANDVSVGALFDERTNIIITGPNAGGKTTMMRSIIFNIILAQALGICPANSCTMPIFSKIITYLNITDDIAAGNSHFKAGVLRAHELINTVEQEEKKGLTFTIVDEVFNGTTFKEGQAAAYSLIKMLGSYLHNCCITCSHFPRISELEQDTQTFTNYQVRVDDTCWPIQYPFKLERGISNQIVTLKILEQEGFGNQFIAQANAMLQQEY